MLLRSLGCVILVVCTSIVSLSQTKTLVLPKPTPSPPPGNIQLVENYVHEPRQGIDAAVGSFKRSDGFVIDYLIGSNVENTAYHRLQLDKNNVLWFKQQWIKNDVVDLVLFTDGELRASFIKSKANFIAKTKNNGDIADFLLMIMTYTPSASVQAKPHNRN